MDRLEGIPLPSNRKFGGFVVTVFTLVALYCLQNDAIWVASVSAFCGLFVGLLAVIFPQTLKPLNRAWMHLGLLMGRLVNPLVLGLMYFLLITPLSLLLRLAGRDELQLKQDERGSYWREREPIGPEADSFRRQY